MVQIVNVQAYQHRSLGRSVGNKEGQSDQGAEKRSHPVEWYCEAGGSGTAVTKGAQSEVTAETMHSAIRMFRQLLGLLAFGPEDFHETCFTRPSPLNFIPCLTTLRPEKRDERFFSKRLPRRHVLKILKKSDSN